MGILIDNYKFAKVIILISCCIDTQLQFCGIVVLRIYIALVVCMLYDY